MKRVELSLPQIGLIAGTRGMLGAGLGLLLADRLSRQQRQAVGWTLLAVGAITTLPLVAQVMEGKGGSGKGQQGMAGRRAGMREREMVESP